MDYRYCYLFGDLIFLAIWLILYIVRKDLRRQMLIVSVFFGFMGLLAAPLYAQDWWHPQTITGTTVGIEDFIQGFVVGGISAAMGKALMRKQVKGSTGRREDYAIASILISMIALYFLLHLSGMSTFNSSMAAFLLPLMYIYLRRRDLIIDSLLSGISLVVVSFLPYILIGYLAPGWVEATWYLDRLSGIIILNAPLEDIIWYFLAGAFISTLYPFWTGGRLKSTPRIP